MSEYQISNIIGLDRTNIYHCCETATREINAGTRQYVKAAEAWMQVITMFPVEEWDSYRFEDALMQFITKSKENYSQLTEEQTIAALENTLNALRNAV